MLSLLKLLWDFTRPHTIIGSFLSITTLFLLAIQDTDGGKYLPVYAWSMVAALACNLYITGLNQITDWEMDRINKPFLPIPAGRLTVPQAWRIILIALLVCLLAATQVSQLFFAIILGILVLGTAYSLPPIRLKRHHTTAAFCIITVRGVLVNLAIGVAFQELVHGQVKQWPPLILLTVFVSVFSLAIAWFKDLYDTKGDEEYKIRTFPLLYSVKGAYQIGNALVLLAYLFAVMYSFWVNGADNALLGWGHALLMLGFIAHIATSSIQNSQGIYRFYMRFWVFFFAEYGLILTYSLLRQ
jgi:homogentisate phytyltransferase / homogentisate geranylgeranyltransferase